ncbi:MAG: glycosyltransferase family 4 protein [Nitrospinae bacterium]|nr:glycosyltransferase family 4 protein [Nitrospinota bacterium]
MTAPAIMSIKSAIPAFVKQPIRDALDGWERKKFVKHLNSSSFSLPSGAPVLSFGGALSRGEKTILSGGRVKLSYLDERYPENAENYNILYLVSSALPKFAAALAGWAKGKGVKIVLNQNGVAYPGWAGKDFEHRNTQMREILELADFIVYQSRFCKEGADKYLGKAACPSEIIYNCVDTSFFVPPASPPPFDVWRILVAGTHNFAYKIMAALNAAASLKNAGRKINVTIAGKLGWQNAEAETMETVRGLGLESDVKFTGPYPRKDAAAVHGGAHMLFHAQYNDASPTTPLEAMACGVPVIGSKSGGTVEIVGDGGILLDAPASYEKIHAPDPAKMAAAAELIMRDWGKWSAAARKTAESRFGKEAWTNKHTMIFGGLIGGTAL